MPSHEEKRILPYSTAEMFSVVSDIEKYPEFVPGCSALRILEREIDGDVERIIAKMKVVLGAFSESYKSRVTLDKKANTVEACHIEGPFEHLDTRWHFVPRDLGSEVHFKIDFAFRNRLLAAASNVLFDKMVCKTADAFVARAALLHQASHHAQQ